MPRWPLLQKDYYWIASVNSSASVLLLTGWLMNFQLVRGPNFLTLHYIYIYIDYESEMITLFHFLFPSSLNIDRFCHQKTTRIITFCIMCFCLFQEWFFCIIFLRVRISFKYENMLMLHVAWRSHCFWYFLGASWLDYSNWVFRNATPGYFSTYE